MENTMHNWGFKIDNQQLEIQDLKWKIDSIDNKKWNIKNEKSINFSNRLKDAISNIGKKIKFSKAEELVNFLTTIGISKKAIFVWLMALSINTALAKRYAWTSAWGDSLRSNPLNREDEDLNTWLPWVWDTVIFSNSSNPVYLDINTTVHTVWIENDLNHAVRINEWKTLSIVWDFYNKWIPLWYSWIQNGNVEFTWTNDQTIRDDLLDEDFRFTHVIINKAGWTLTALSDLQIDSSLTLNSWYLDMDSYTLKLWTTSYFGDVDYNSGGVMWEMTRYMPNDTITNIELPLADNTGNDIYTILNFKYTDSKPSAWRASAQWVNSSPSPATADTSDADGKDIKEIYDWWYLDFVSTGWMFDIRMNQSFVHQDSARILHKNGWERVPDGVHFQSGNIVGRDSLTNDEFVIGKIAPNTVLPVSLISCESEVKWDDIHITRTTASEQNNSHFMIEKSTDLNNWETIATEPWAWNSNEINQYEIVDHQELEWKFYYRITQVDYNWQEKTYPPIVATKQAHEDNLVSVYPNPSDDFLRIQKDEFETVKIYNIHETHIMTTQDDEIDVSWWSKWVYIIQIWDKEAVKVIIM